MSNVLPNLLAALSAVALVTALYALFRSLRAAFLGETQVLADEALVTDTRAALIVEKEALVASLRDLAADHEAGKTSDEDLEHSNARLRARAKAVLRALEEEIAPHRAAAEAMLALPAAGENPAPRDEAPAKASPARAAKVEDVKVATKAEAAKSEDAKSARADDTAVAVATIAKSCFACGATNDDDAAFCKKCGKPIEQGAET